MLRLPECQELHKNSAYIFVMPDSNLIAHAPNQPKLSKAKLKLIDATLESLMEEGVDGCSVRKICARASASTGLINYHFGSLHHLLAAAYQHLASNFLEKAMSTANPVADTKQRTLVFLTEIFQSQVTQPKILRAWIVFWSLIDTEPSIKAAQKTTNAAFTQHLEDLFADMHKPKLSPRLAAIGLSAMIDGLWLETCLGVDTVSAEECVALCMQWVDSISS